MLTIGVKQDSVVEIIAPDGTVIKIAFKRLKSRGMIGIDAPIEYKINRTKHQPAAQADQLPQHQEHKPECSA